MVGIHMYTYMEYIIIIVRNEQEIPRAGLKLTQITFPAWFIYMRYIFRRAFVLYIYSSIYILIWFNLMHMYKCMKKLISLLLNDKYCSSMCV